MRILIHDEILNQINQYLIIYLIQEISFLFQNLINEY